MKKNVYLLMSVLAISLFLVSSVSAQCSLNLPSNPVNMVAVDGASSYFDVTLSGVPAGFDVANGIYLGWCIDTSITMPRGDTFAVMLYSSCNPPSDPDLDDFEWDKVNYILNHKPLTATVYEIQEAIWNYVNLGGSYTPSLAGALAIVADAELYGDGFAPVSGEVVAVILIPVDTEIPEPAQATIIELMIPGYEGLTPGFWKNHVNCWMGYSPGEKFSDVFGVQVTINAGKKDENTDPTLLDALKAKGGVNEDKRVYDALVRHAVAALLNAGHVNVGYPWTEQAIIDAVADAIGNGGAGPLKNMLDDYNNLGGGIDAHCNPI
jgi:hypothetical protein